MWPALFLINKQLSLFCQKQYYSLPSIWTPKYCTFQRAQEDLDTRSTYITHKKIHRGKDIMSKINFLIKRMIRTKIAKCLPLGGCHRRWTEIDKELTRSSNIISKFFFIIRIVSVGPHVFITMLTNLCMTIYILLCRVNEDLKFLNNIVNS